VELFERIRRDNRDRGVSVRALAAKHRVHRRTVRDALASAEPPERRTPQRAAPALGPWKSVIDTILEEDRGVPRKQRHTARRIWQRLGDEHDARVAESTVRSYVGQRRRELANLTHLVTVPQLHEPGAEAEVDFGELYVWLDGVLTKVWMFILRLSASGKAVHRVYATQAQEAFFDGFVTAFSRLGGVARRVRLDNLKPAVARILTGRNRQENERFVVLRSTYGFDSFYCRPGIEGSHEKGGVEGEVGRFRRRHLVPVPKVASLEELNQILAAIDDAEDARHIDNRATTIGEDFAVERGFLLPLPVEAFDPTRHLSVKVDTKARVCVRQCRYSVPARLACRELVARLGATTVEVFEGSRLVARHARLVHRGEESLVLDHYLEVLAYKPGALPGATALAQARASGGFGPAHEAYWAEARRRLGDGPGTKALIEVLLLHRKLAAETVVAGINAALTVGVIDASVVGIEARRAAKASGAVVVPIGELGRFDRPAPALAGYDELLDAREAVG
jgi:transposase